MYLSLAGQKLCVDQVEFPEALLLSLECCCIVPSCTLKRSELCLPWCLLGQGQGKSELECFERANGALSVDGSPAFYPLIPTKFLLSPVPLPLSAFIEPPYF